MNFNGRQNSFCIVNRLLNTCQSKILLIRCCLSMTAIGTRVLRHFSFFYFLWHDIHTRLIICVHSFLSFLFLIRFRWVVSHIEDIFKIDPSNRWIAIELLWSDKKKHQQTSRRDLDFSLSSSFIFRSMGNKNCSRQSQTDSLSMPIHRYKEQTSFESKGKVKFHFMKFN